LADATEKVVETNADGRLANLKKYTSKFLKSVAIFYLGFPLFYIVCAALLFDIPARAYFSILLSPGYYVLSVFAIAVGYALWEVQRWGWYLFVGTNFLIAYENAVAVTVYGTSHHKVMAFFASLFFLLVLSFRVAKEIRVPYFFPKIRWWESNPRYKLSVPVKIMRTDGTTTEGQIMDLSMGGCFVKIRSEIVQHEAVRLSFVVFGLELECPGVIVWRTQSTVTMPKGVGVKFSPMARAEKRILKLIHHRLKKIAHFYRRSRYLLNQDDFLKRLNEIEKGTFRSSSARKRLIG